MPKLYKKVRHRKSIGIFLTYLIRHHQYSGGAPLLRRLSLFQASSWRRAIRWSTVMDIVRSPKE